MAEEEQQEKEQAEGNEGSAEENGGTSETKAGAEGNEGSAENPPAGRTVNRIKHERDMAKKDDRIKELEAENAKLKGESEAVAGLTKRLDAIEAKAKAEKIEKSLKAAGCRNVKAAVACLDDHDGDIEKLKEAEPYLFTSNDNSKSTGGNPKGKPSDDEDEKLDKAFGLK